MSLKEHVCRVSLKEHVLSTDDTYAPLRTDDTHAHAPEAARSLKRQWADFQKDKGIFQNRDSCVCMCV